MRTARPKSLLERSPDSDLWRHTLSQIPTLFGRLVYLAELRSPLNGKYEHHGFSLLYGEAEADRAIRQSHRKTFGEFLAASLEEKVSDIDAYIRSTGETSSEILQYLARTEAWNTFLPIGALNAEKSLFSSELKHAIRILLAASGAGGPRRDA